VTMRLSSIVMEIWPFKVLPGRLFQNRGRSSVGPQYYTDLIYSSSLRSAHEVKNCKMPSTSWKFTKNSVLSACKLYQTLRLCS